MLKNTEADQASVFLIKNLVVLFISLFFCYFSALPSKLLSFTQS